MPRIPVWLSNIEFEVLQKKCEQCGLAPYSYIKKLLLKDLEEEQDVGKGKDGSGTEERRQRTVEVSY